MSAQPSPYDAVQKLERELGMPDGWFLSLLNQEESDWSFVIKLHALFEAAIAHAINANLNRPELRELVERLNMRGPISKTALGRALKVLDPKNARLIKQLSAIRNDCVHDVRNVAFKFDGYVSELERERREALLRAFEGYLAAEMPDVQDKKVPRDEFVWRRTRFAFWVAATIVLADLYAQKELAEAFAKGIAQFTLRDEKGLLSETPLPLRAGRPG